MSTKIQYVKSGTTISCDSTVLPRPTVQAEYPLPAFNQLSNSYLTLSLPTISSTGLPSVQVNSALTLPGPAGSWTLNYISYQGSMPVNPVWQTITIPGLTVNSLIPNVIPSGTFTAYLSQTVGTQTLNYAQASIATSADSTYASLSTLETTVLGFAAFNQLSPAQQVIANADYNSLVAEQTALQTEALAVGLPASSYATLATDLAALNTYLTGLSGWLVANTIVNIVPSTWSATWQTVFTDITNLNNTIQTAINNINNGSLGSGGNYIPNGTSELGPMSGTGGNLVYDTTNQGYLGSRYVRAINHSGITPASYALTDKILCNIGDVFDLSGMVCVPNNTGTFPGQHDATISVVFYDASNNPITNAHTGMFLTVPIGLNTTPGTWTQLLPVQRTLSGGTNYYNYYGAGTTYNAPYGTPQSGIGFYTATGVYCIVYANVNGYTGELWFDNLIFTKTPKLATTSVPGAVIAGAGLAVDTTSGTLSVPSFSGSTAGLVPTSSGGTTNFLRADGTWAAGTGGGSISLTDNNSTNATYYPVFATTAGGNTLETSSTGLKFNPATATLTTSYINNLGTITSVDGIFTDTTASTSVNTGSLRTQSIGVAGNIYQNSTFDGMLIDQVQNITTTTANNKGGIRQVLNITQTAGTPSLLGVYSTINEQGNSPFAQMIAGGFIANHAGSSTSGYVVGAYGFAILSGGSGTITNSYGVWGRVAVAGGVHTNLYAVGGQLLLGNNPGGANSAATLTNSATFYAPRPTTGTITGNTLTNLAGLWIEDNTAIPNITVTNTYAIYSPGAAQSLFGGPVSMGSLTANNASYQQALFYGWSQFSGAGGGRGCILLGNNSSWQGSIDYSDLGNTALTFRNSYTASTTAINFMLGSTQVLSLQGSGSAYFAGALLMPNSVQVSSVGLNNLGIQTASGLTKIGMLNSSYCHYDTAGSSGHYFYQNITTPGTVSASGINATSWAQTPYTIAINYTTAGYVGNWLGSNYFGIGNDNTNHKLRLGQVTSTGVWSTPPGDLLLQVDGTINAYNSLTIANYSYPTTYTTQLCSRGGGTGVLQLGNNGVNEIRFGNTATGGYGQFFTNNTADGQSASNGNLTLQLNTDMTVVIGPSNDRAITINPNYGYVGIRAGSGGWSEMFGTRKSDNSVFLGAFGIFGGGDTCSYTFIGTDYNSYWMKCDTSGNVTANGSFNSSWFNVSNGAQITNYWSGATGTTIWANNPTSSSYEFGILNSAQTIWTMRTQANGNVTFGGTQLTVMGYNANSASLILNNPGQYIGFGNLTSNEAKIANCNSTGAWDSSNPNMDLYLGYNNNLVLHMGNIGTNAATLQAAVANATAPKVGTLSQMYAWTPPTNFYPYWYATDGTDSNGDKGGMYLWNGSNWIWQNVANTVQPKITAGLISAGAIGAQALAANIVTTSVITSSAYAAGSGSTAPVGFKLAGNPFTTYYLDGTNNTNCYMEIGGDVNVGGLQAAVIANRVKGNTPTWTSNGTWVCPQGITSVTLTLQGKGGDGGPGTSLAWAGGGGAAGNYIQKVISVTPATTYYISFDSGTVNFRTGSYSGTILYSASVGATATGQTGAVGSGVGTVYYPTPELGWNCTGNSGNDGATYNSGGGSTQPGGLGGVSPYDAGQGSQVYGSGGKGQNILKGGGTSGSAGTGLPGFARIKY